MTNEQVLDKIHELNFAMFQEFDKICRKYDIKYTFASGALLGAVRHKGFIPWDNDIDIWITRDNFEKFYEHQEELPEEYQLVMPDIHGSKKYLDCVPRLNYKYMYIKMDEELCRFYNNRNNRMDLDMFIIDKTYSDFRGKIHRLEMAIMYGLLNSYRHPIINQNYSTLMKIIGAFMKIVGRCISLNTLRKWTTKIATKYNDRTDTDAYFPSNDGAALKHIVPEHTLKEIIYVEFESGQAPIPVGADEILKIWFGDYMKLPPEEQRIPHWGSTLITPDKFIFEEPPTLE